MSNPCGLDHPEVPGERFRDLREHYGPTPEQLEQLLHRGLITLEEFIDQGGKVTVQLVTEVYREGLVQWTEFRKYLGLDG
jgi:hypothetical protein